MLRYRRETPLQGALEFCQKWKNGTGISAILRGKQPFCVFEPPLGDLEATYDIHPRLIGKRAVNFLLVLI